LVLKALLSVLPSNGQFISVNNAGTAFPHSSLSIDKQSIEQIFSVNVLGTIFLTQAAVPHMPKGGRIVNISSVASKLGMVNLPIYGASKAAVDSLSYAWAKEVSHIFIPSDVHRLTHPRQVRPKQRHHGQFRCSRPRRYGPRSHD
jgi:short-subunit dehydrogenase